VTPEEVFLKVTTQASDTNRMSGEVRAFDTSLQGAGILLDMKEEEFQPGRESTMGTPVELSISCR